MFRGGAVFCGATEYFDEVSLVNEEEEKTGTLALLSVSLADFTS